MTTSTHPITPSPELMEAWSCAVDCNKPTFAQVAVMAARWGADQELDACCAYLAKAGLTGDACGLQLTRRPMPPSLKEQALAALGRLNSGALCANPVADRETIRRALEHLDD